MYDFINYNPKKESFMDKSLHDVKKEDLMKIQRLDKKKVEE